MAFPDLSGPRAMRVFACPRCGEMLLTGSRSCEYCAAPLAGCDTETLADHREVCRKAFAEVRSTLVAAWLLLPAFALRLLPFVGDLLRLGLLALLAWVPFRVLSWYVVYADLAPFPEATESRRQLRQALGIWALAATAEAVLRSGLVGGR